MRSNFRKFATASLLAGVAFLLFPVPSLKAQQLRRIAVLSFGLGEEAKQMATNSLHIQGDLGKDLADQLVAKLVTDHKFVVIERRDLTALKGEQNMENGDRFDPAQATRIGKLAGADYVVIGSVTQLTGSDQPTPMGLAGKFIAAGYVERKASVSVAITARLIETSTGEIVSSTIGKADASKVYRSVKSVKLDTTSTDFGNGTLHDATLKAIISTADQLEASAGTAAAPRAIAAAPPRAAYKGMVADVSGKTLILTSGSAAGAKVGDVVQISRFDHNVYSPANPKLVIKVVTKPIGTASITEVDDGTATATYSGSGLPQVKDAVTYAP